MTTVSRSALTLRTVLGAAAVASFSLSLGACSGFKDAIGASKQSPDEFAIQTRAPLAVPAEFKTLPKPQPGALRPQDSDTATQAQVALAGSAPPRPASEGENALLNTAGADKADNKVRQELMAEQRERRAEAARRSYADTILFWKSSPEDSGQPLNPSEEQERLRENPQPVATASAPPPPAETSEENKPETQPVIEKDGNGGWFSGWF